MSFQTSHLFQWTGSRGWTGDLSYYSWLLYHLHIHLAIKEISHQTFHWFMYNNRLVEWLCRFTHEPPSIHVRDIFTLLGIWHTQSPWIKKAQPGLSRWPIRPQLIALPLSYTPTHKINIMSQSNIHSSVTRYPVELLWDFGHFHHFMHIKSKLDFESHLTS